MGVLDQWFCANYLELSNPFDLLTSVKFVLYFRDTFLQALGSLSKDDGNGKDNARKQWSDWLNEENNRAARAARTLA